MRRLLAAFAAATPFAAQAADRDPLSISVREYGFMLAVAILGGLVSWIAKVRAGQAAAWNVMQLIGELATSAFAGLLCFWICEAAGTSSLVTVCMVGISGHMGTRAIAAFEAWAAKRWGVSLPESPQ